MNKIGIVSGIIVMLSGIVFAFSSHELHNSVFGMVAGHSAEEGHSSFTEDHGSHDTHQLTGFAVAGIGLIITLISWKISFKRKSI